MDKRNIHINNHIFLLLQYILGSNKSTFIFRIPYLYNLHKNFCAHKEPLHINMVYPNRPNKEIFHLLVGLFTPQSLSFKAPLPLFFTHPPLFKITI
jgi:hypothetical protein